MSDQMRQDRDLVLPPGTFAYVLDQTKGKISVYVGPFKNSLSNTDQLVVWQDGRFVPLDTQAAIHTFVKAVEGQYIVLSDPAHEEPERFPQPGMASDSIELDAGKMLVIPGPRQFPLWPGQTAKVIDGHHLRHNQYLVVRVYEPDEARAHGGAAVVAGVDEAVMEQEFTMGQLIVIKGTDVSFYVPPTGIEVVPERSDERGGRRPGELEYVREAPTLEQLEYAVLRDENGRKRFERGPAVVFPEPTETFLTDSDGSRKFRAIELNPQSGLYIKVIAPYEEDGVHHQEGEELFLTGEDTPIYFPRVEHSIIQYGPNRKHHAVAIPSGEGRYVLDRMTGEVDLITGPRMFLADPRTQVIVRRVLDPRVVEVMYPGNEEALAINRLYEQQRREREQLAEVDYLETEAPPSALRSTSALLASESTPNVQFGGEKMRRGTEYTPPRTITLDTKYDGAVAVSVWPGYAVLVMNKTGDRRVVEGPSNILLAYDESLMVLSLSTGQPKDDKRKLRTAYLRTINNAVTDRITVETRDLVPVTIFLSLRVNFEGETADERWFDVEDYIALLTDHCRSKLRNAAKRHGIREFYADTIDIIRDSLLGPSTDGLRTGLYFSENAMRLYDVEVLKVDIQSHHVGEMLEQATTEALEGAIELDQAEDRTQREQRIQELKRETLTELELTREAEAKAAEARVERQLRQELAEIDAQVQATTDSAKVSELKRDVIEKTVRQEVGLTSARNEVDISRLREEVQLFVTRMESVSPDLVASLKASGDQAFVERLVTDLGPAALASGVTTADLMRQVFSGTPFENMFELLGHRPLASGNGQAVVDVPTP